MLRKNWPGDFRRTITLVKKGKDVKHTLEFKPGEPVEVTPAEAELLRADIGVSLVPVEFDIKARPRVITDDVVPDAEETGTVTNESAGSN